MHVSIDGKPARAEDGFRAVNADDAGSVLRERKIRGEEMVSLLEEFGGVCAASGCNPRFDFWPAIRIIRISLYFIKKIGLKNVD